MSTLLQLQTVADNLWPYLPPEGRAELVAHLQARGFVVQGLSAIQQGGNAPRITTPPKSNSIWGNIGRGIDGAIKTIGGVANKYLEALAAVQAFKRAEQEIRDGGQVPSPVIQTLPSASPPAAPSQLPGWAIPAAIGAILLLVMR